MSAPEAGCPEGPAADGATRDGWHCGMETWDTHVLQNWAGKEGGDPALGHEALCIEPA